MTKILVILLTVLALSVASDTCYAGVQLRTPAGAVAQPYQKWADRSKMPTPNVTVTMGDWYEGVCGSTEPACAWPGLIRMTPFGDPGHTRRAFMHELGHQFDYFAMTDAKRAQFETLLGDTRPWHTSPNSPHEQFAEAWGICARGRGLMGGHDRPYGTYNY